MNSQPGAWIVSTRVVDATGHTVGLPTACFQSSGGRPPNLAACFAQHGIKFVESYQPASRYWDLQWAETGLYLVLAAGLGGLCYWAVRRRQRSA
jgi:hypothetical protein